MHFVARRGVHQSAFGPLGGSGSTLHQHPVITEIAQRRGCDSGSVMLSWGIQKGQSGAHSPELEGELRPLTLSGRNAGNGSNCFTQGGAVQSTELGECCFP